MDKRVLRERMRKKQQQIRRRQMMKKGAYVVAVILVFIFVIRGIILPVINRVGGKNTDKPAQVQAETDTNANTNTGDSGTETQIEKDTNAAIRKPLKGASDLTKASQLTAGWHEDENGKWYQNSDGTYYAGGLQEIDGSTYYFDKSGYMVTGWKSIESNWYYFNASGCMVTNTWVGDYYLDFDGNINDEKVKNALLSAENHCSYSRILGCYKKASI